jgi:hypothetical protein
MSTSVMIKIQGLKNFFDGSRVWTQGLMVAR